MRQPPQANRRRLLKAGAVSMLATTLAPFASSLKAASANVTELGDSLFLLQGLGANVVARLTPEGTLLVDSGAPGYQRELMDTLGSLDAQRVATLVNTHWHTEQTGANELLGSEGATIVAHERGKQWMSHPYWVPAEDRYEPARPEAARPTETFYEALTLDADGEAVELGYLIEAHTSADIFVHFRDANVIAVGDVLSPQLDPTFDYFTGAWIGGRRDALEQLEKRVDSDTVIVPAVGPLLSLADMQAEHELMAAIYDRTVDLVRQGYGPRDMLEDGFMSDLPRQLDDPYQFLYDLCQGLWAHHNKLAPNIV